ncbi:MAG: hypothetical protein ACKVP0_03780 [Pirellulaceae bacterium]
MEKTWALVAGAALWGIAGWMMFRFPWMRRKGVSLAAQRLAAWGFVIIACVTLLLAAFEASLEFLPQELVRSMKNSLTVFEVGIVTLIGVFTVAAYVACWIWIQDFPLFYAP